MRLVMRLAPLAFFCVLLLSRSALADPTFIYIRGQHDVLMSGDLEDVDRVRKTLKSKDRVLWTRTSNGTEYVIRDSATLDELERAWKPAEELASQMGKLGEEQGKLGEQVGKLGEAQGRLGERMGGLGEDLARADDAERAQIEREMRELERKMRDLEKQMKKFEKPMRVLERKMREVEPKHNAAAKEAGVATETLISRAITSGIAKRF